MSYTGGVYGDYEVAPSTRVFERRSSAERVYNTRLYNAKGGMITTYFTFIPALSLGYLAGETLFKTNSKKLLFVTASSLGLAYFFNAWASRYFGNHSEYSFLVNNKASVKAEIEKALVEDYNNRNKIFPKLEEVKEESSVESSSNEGEGEAAVEEGEEA